MCRVGGVKKRDTLCKSEFGASDSVAECVGGLATVSLDVRVVHRDGSGWGFACGCGARSANGSGVFWWALPSVCLHDATWADSQYLWSFAVIKQWDLCTPRAVADIGQWGSGHVAPVVAGIAVAIIIVMPILIDLIMMIIIDSMYMIIIIVCNCGTPRWTHGGIPGKRVRRQETRMGCCIN